MKEGVECCVVIYSELKQSLLKGGEKSLRQETNKIYKAQVFPNCQDLGSSESYKSPQGSFPRLQAVNVCWDRAAALQWSGLPSGQGAPGM